MPTFWREGNSRPVERCLQNPVQPSHRLAPGSVVDHLSTDLPHLEHLLPLELLPDDILFGQTLPASVCPFANPQGDCNIFVDDLIATVDHAVLDGISNHELAFRATLLAFHLIFCPNHMDEPTNRP